MTSPPTGREARLAQALRDNLRRRKAQARDRDARSTVEPTQSDEHPPEQRD